MLHITNGDSVLIGQTGIPGGIVCWNDVLHEGAVPPGIPFDELSRYREQFLSGFVDFPVSFAQRDAALKNFRDHEEVVLWFEHDLFDQLQLIQILDWFARQDRTGARVSLICIDRYLGILHPAELLALFPSRHEVRAAEYQTAQAAWAAFRTRDPRTIRSVETSALPFLGAAFDRYIEELPSPVDGLSRTQRQALQLIAGGHTRFEDLFVANQKLEAAVFMGDSTFRAHLGKILPSQ